MKIKIIEIEATSEDLKESRSAAEGFSQILRNAFARGIVSARGVQNYDDEEDAEDTEEDAGEDENDEQ